MVGARGLAQRALVALHKDSSRRLRAALEGRGVEGREFALAYELAHGVARRERLLDHVLAGVAHRGLPKDPELLVALRLGAYQLIFTSGVPAHAAVHETVALVRHNKGFCNAVLRRIAGMIRERPADPSQPRHQLPMGANRSFELPSPLSGDVVEQLAVLHSLPDWLARRVNDQHGSDALAQLASAASATPPVHLRSRVSVDHLVASLQAEDVEVERVGDGPLLRWRGGASPFGVSAFQEGAFVAQDPTAASAAAALPCRAGDTVIDLCAAPGTKTAVLAELVGERGKVFASDPDDVRRARIAENVSRLRLERVVEVVDDEAMLKPADGVLADVPCSNTGVLGRRVEVRRRLTPADFAALAGLQRQILDRAISLTRVGGYLVYSTCSVDRDENEDVVASALVAHSDLELIKQRLTMPLQGQCDGGFYALMRRVS